MVSASADISAKIVVVADLTRAAFHWDVVAAAITWAMVDNHNPPLIRSGSRWSMAGPLGLARAYG